MRLAKNKNFQKRFQFKKRGITTTQTTKLLYGFYGLWSPQQQRIEGVYIKKIKLKYRKSFKKFKKQSRPQSSKKLMWIRYQPNIALTRKSKNARMGSGKGKLTRKAANIKPQQTIVEFRKITFFFLKKLKKYFLRKWAIKTYFITLKKTHNICKWTE